MRSIPALILILSIAPLAAFAGEQPAPADPGPPDPASAEADGESIISIHADIMEGTQDAFAAAGTVRITYEGVILLADRALGWYPRKEAYVEGNVRMITADREYTCNRGFINWESQEIVFEDFLVRSRDKTKELTWYVATPLGMRIADGTVVAKNATVSNCDYAVPHQYLRVREIVIRPSGTAVIKGVSYYVHSVPLPIYLPAMIIPAGRPSLSAGFGNSSRFGTYARLSAGFDLPVGFDALGTVKLGYFSERGPAWGVGVDYHTPLITLGRAEYYTVPDDQGKDVDLQTLGTTHRYRYRWQQSIDSPAGWELDAELQKYSDAGFEREYFRNDYFNDKEPENRVYLKHASDNWAGFVEAKVRLNGYLEQTEHLPVAGVRGFSQPLGASFLWTSATEFGFLRRKLSDVRRRPDDTDASYAERRLLWNAFQDLPPISAAEQQGADRTVFRLDTIHEISRPFAIDWLKIEPFAGVRETFYDKRLQDDGDVARSQLFYGSRFSTSFYQMYDANSEFFNIDGIRHIVTPDVVYVARTDAWGAGNDELIALDETENLQRQDRIALRLRNQFQTRRNDKVIDLVDFDLETDAYPHSNRDHGGESFSDLRIDTRMHPHDHISITSLANYDFSQEGKGLSFFNIGADVELTSRWAAGFGHTYERGYESYGTYSLAYTLTPNWSIALYNDRDWNAGRSLEERVELIRDFHEFTFSVAIENDRRLDNKSVSVNIEPKSVKMPPRAGSFVRKFAEAQDEEE